MYNIQVLNKISKSGLSVFPQDKYIFTDGDKSVDCMLVRSLDLFTKEFEKSVKAIARAGAGTNNIPIEKCSEKGIVVFNTPGANANAVKELVITGLFLASRNIVGGIKWANGLKGRGEEVPKLVEKGKSNFEGPEVKGKTLGVLGLGAIGVLVANAALSLGMKVVGYDPYISIEAAWSLSSQVERASSVEQLLSKSDYLTIHIPYTENTKNFISADKFNVMKNGIKILNFARAGIVSNTDLKVAMENKKVSTYVTDFPEDDLLGIDNIISIPHLGASTPESEGKCAVMTCEQLREFLEKGNIKNSVNLPDCILDISSSNRLTIIHDNIPNMVGQITSILAKHGINIENMINKHRGAIAYTVIDIDGCAENDVIDRIEEVDGVKRVRLISTGVSQ